MAFSGAVSWGTGLSSVRVRGAAAPGAMGFGWVFRAGPAWTRSATASSAKASWAEDDGKAATGPGRLAAPAGDAAGWSAVAAPPAPLAPSPTAATGAVGAGGGG